MLNEFSAADDGSTLDQKLARHNFMAMASAQNSDVGRAPGLLLTTEDVRQIRAYVQAGLALPVDLDQVRTLLGGQSGISGLAPEDIRDLYQAIKEHCQSWNPLESNIRKVGSDLNVFSANLLIVARQLITFIKGLESYQGLKVGDLTLEQIEQLPPVEIKPGDRQKIPVLVDYIGDLKILLEQHSASTLEVKNGVSTFKTVLKTKIAPDVSLKVRLSSSAETDEEIARLNAEATALAERIEHKANEYSEYVKYALIGLWWGPVGVAITGGIYGQKAEQVRHEKNALIEEKRIVEKKLLDLNKLLGLLRGLETNLEDLEGRIHDATVGISGLESLWLLMTELVESSRDRLVGLDNATYLAILESRFTSIISNWTAVEKQSLDLLTAFDKAIAR